MQIFYLDQDPVLCAQAHSDQHLDKMLLEGIQILCTAAHRCGANDVPYGATHEGRQCVLWAGDSFGNWCWLSQLVLELENERKFRRGPDYNPHKSLEIFKKFGVRALREMHFDKKKFFIPPVDLPPIYKHAATEHDRSSDLGLNASLYAYRLYYRHEKCMFGGKFASWFLRGKPGWWNRYGVIDPETGDDSMKVKVAEETTE